MLSQWTIYERPTDYPVGFVVRRYDIVPGLDPIVGPAWTAGSLEEARKLIPPGLLCMPRAPADQRPIVETWI